MLPRVLPHHHRRRVGRLPAAGLLGVLLLGSAAGGLSSAPAAAHGPATLASASSAAAAPPVHAEHARSLAGRSGAHARAGDGTTLVDETFEGATVADPNFMGLNSACLTGAASTATASNGLGGCTTHTVNAPTAGTTPGYLQLTDTQGNEVGGIVYNQAIPANAGLHVQFKQYQYGGSTADGIGFFLSDGSKTLTQTGAAGGALGYAQGIGQNAPGANGGYLGVGLDSWGNYATNVNGQGQGCPTPAPNDKRVPNTVTLRGPGQGLDGYCYLTSTIASGASTLPVNLRGTSLADAERLVDITVSPGDYPTVTVMIDGTQVLQYTMTDKVPPTYKFGYSASTGGANDTHLIRSVKVSTINPLSDLNLVKQIDHTTPQPATYQVGATVPYQFVVTNGGALQLDDVAVTDPSISDISCPSTTLAPAGQPGSTMTCTGTHTLTAADVDSKGDFTNTAQAAGTNPTGTEVKSNESSVTVPVTYLKLSKTADPASAEPGGKVTYTVTAENVGADYTGATFTDDLTGVLEKADYDNDASATTGTPAYAEPKLTWTGDLKHGQKATLTYSVTVKKAGIAPPAQLVNTVTGPSDSNCTGTAAAAPPCSTTVPITWIDVTKKADPASSVKPGQKVTYTLTAVNKGAAQARGATLTDDLTPLLDDAAYNNDAKASTGTVTYSRPTLTWTGDLAPNATAVITFSVTVDQVDRGDGNLANTVVGPNSSTCPKGSTDAFCTAGPKVTPPTPKPTPTPTPTVHPGKPGPAGAALPRTGVQDLTTVLGIAAGCALLGGLFLTAALRRRGTRG
ncbi:hypothetical protein BIV57_05455 [Mangrovactinospora gilvigrisea]|uniref:DUF11 domain-containing protein n=1 Tax=Mangrovactinospora gilvigrisea TaxID=1428644 RepID=A0A1J7BIP5_9ACTN|nr:DUF11 domain-containing protein [Mangrovactinospora gilvigrisea]OIV38453.1 hypothetical protein BIV57_05455 [Mangrovactinospora gilvigrisea]